ncbi:MAG: hypothetical protein DMF37_01870 [Verrucomicrobia bacterium]|nr:MAG: hypothetical protein DMF37_01870 [Verrucomicrobiota bacterium]
MKMNCLERLQELVSRVKKARPFFDREGPNVFQADPPDAFQLCVFHQWFGHIAQGCCSRVLRGELGYARAPMHLQREI